MRTFSSLILASLLSLFFADRVLAQWVQTSLDSCDVLCFAVSGSNLFAGTGQDGVFRSTDNGISWAKANTGLTGTSVIALAVSDTNLFAGTYTYGVFRSTNSGASWMAAGSGQTYSDVYALAIKHNDAGGTDLFAATAAGNGYGVYLSTNNGANWTNVSDGLTTTCVSPTCWPYTLVLEGSNLFAGTVGRGVFLSTNNGANWKTVNTGLPNTGAGVLAVNGANIYAGAWGDSGGVFLSSNNGTSWTNISNGLTNRHIGALAVYGTNLFAGTGGGGVFLSTDNGTTWAEVSTGLKSTWATALAVSGTNLFVGMTRFDTIPGGVWRRPLSEMVTSVGGPLRDVPARFGLDQNYPNPYNPNTTISYSLPQKSFVTLKLYDLLGREVRTLVNSEQEPGNYTRIVEANDLPSGVYFYRLQAGKFTDIKKMLLIR